MCYLYIARAKPLISCTVTEQLIYVFVFAYVKYRFSRDAAKVLCLNIYLRNHAFDSKMRAKRSAQRKLATIADVDDAAKGVGRVRQHHHCDQSKIMAKKRLGKPYRSLPFSNSNC